MSDPLRVKGTLDKGAGAGRILCVGGYCGPKLLVELRQAIGKMV